MLDLVLRNIRLPDGRVADLAFKDGRLHHIGSAGRSHETIDCRDLLCIPAATDMHVHMRGGVQSAKEDWRFGTMAALAGGVTMVVDQPNTIPPLTTPELYRNRVKEAEAGALCSFAVNGGVTAGSNLFSLWREGAMAFGEIFAAPSSYGDALTLHELETALKDIDTLMALATIHAEEVLPGSPGNLSQHHLNRSPEGEARFLHLIKKRLPIGMKPHICHLSSPDSLAAAPGSKEVTPHHLFLSLDRFEPDNTYVKVNPPIRPESIRRSLFSLWNEIDIIASDHAPHTRSDKDVPFADAPSGVPGVETMLPLLMNQVKKGSLSLSSVIRKTAIAPCRVLGIPPAGFQSGERADFALYAMQPEPILPENLHSKSGWTPFEGMNGIFPTMVIHHGRVAYHDGNYSMEPGCWLNGRGYYRARHIL